MSHAVLFQELLAGTQWTGSVALPHLQNEYGVQMDESETESYSESTKQIISPNKIFGWQQNAPLLLYCITIYNVIQTDSVHAVSEVCAVPQTLNVLFQDYQLSNNNFESWLFILTIL